MVLRQRPTGRKHPLAVTFCFYCYVTTKGPLATSIPKIAASISPGGTPRCSVRGAEETEGGSTSHKGEGTPGQRNLRAQYRET